MPNLLTGRCEPNHRLAIDRLFSMPLTDLRVSAGGEVIHSAPHR